MKKAIWKGFSPVIGGFYKGFSFLLKKQKEHLTDLPLNQKSVRVEYLTGLALVKPEVYHKKVLKLQASLTGEYKRAASCMLKNITDNGT